MYRARINSTLVKTINEITLQDRRIIYDAQEIKEPIGDYDTLIISSFRYSYVVKSSDLEEVTGLTEEDKKWYVENKGLKCPYCKAEKKTKWNAPHPNNATTLHKRGHCSICDKTRTEIYTLTGIEEIKEDKE